MASSNRVNLIDPTTGLTATTTGAATSMGPRTKKFVGYVAVTALGAGTTLTPKIQHSPDGTNWFDLVSFTALVATGSELKYENNFTVANSPVLSQVRGVCTFAGGTTTGTVRLDLWFDEDK